MITDHLFVALRSGWNFQTGSDPTGGLVNYIDQELAMGAAQLAYVQSDNTTIVAVDDTSAVAIGGLRNSYVAVFYHELSVFSCVC